MMRLTSRKVMETLATNNVFCYRKNTDYQIGIKNEQIAFENLKTREIAYLGNTLESAIQLKKLTDEYGKNGQKEAVDKALDQLMHVEVDEWV